MLDDSEAQLLGELIRKLSWPVPKVVFDALCEKLIMCPLELAVLEERDDGLSLLLHHREQDAYYDGTTWHMPGTILRPGETAETGLVRLIASEVGSLRGTPEFFGCYDVLKGTEAGTSERGQVMSRLFTVRIASDDVVSLDDGKKFFPLASIEEKMLINDHKLYVRLLRERLI